MKKKLKVIGIIELGGTISSISEHATSEFYKGPVSSVSSRTYAKLIKTDGLLSS